MSTTDPEFTRRASAPPADDEPIAVGVPLAKLIKRRLLPQPELVMVSHPRSVAAERFRQLRTILVNQEEQVQVIVVTSGMAEEGKSTVAMNLAMAFAGEKNERTLIIDADLRRPRLADWLQPAPQLGLNEVVSGLAPLDHAVLSLEDSSLKVLPAGRASRQPAELLASERMKDLLSTLRKRYHRVIIDTPPIVPFTDADVVGAMSDGVLVVARSCVTAVASYEQAIASVSAARVLGTVLNDVGFSLADADRFYGRYGYGRYGYGRYGQGRYGQDRENER